MKALDYKEFLEETGGVYELDWTRNAVHYIEPLHGVRVYAHGEVTISRSGYRDPEWRARLHTLTGLTANMVKDDFYGKQFFSPQGEPITKASVTNDMLIYDPDRKVAYPTKNWGASLSFFYHDELARSGERVYVLIPRPDLKKAKLAEFKECIELGTTLAAVGKPGQDGYFLPKRLTDPTKAILTAGVAPKDLTKKDAQAFCLNIVQSAKQFEQFMTNVTNNMHYYDYLIVEEKEK